MFTHPLRAAKQKYGKAPRRWSASLRHPTRPAPRSLFRAAPGCGRLGHRLHRQGGLLRLGKRRATSHVRRRDPHKHEIRIPMRPAQRLLFGLEKAIDHDRVAFHCRAAGKPGRFAAADSRAGIDREQRSIRQRDFASVRNPARIDRAVPGAQPRAGRANMLTRPAIGSFSAAGPVNCHARQDRLFGGLRRRNQGQQKEECD